MSNEKKSIITRRDFLGGTAATAAAFTIVPRHVLGRQGQKSPSEKLNIAGVGGKGFGFTLIELLVVISIIAVLLSIMVPALNNAREMASGSRCLGNQKNLITAWIMYSMDNAGRMVGGCSYHGDAWPGTEYAWCKEPGYRDSSGTYVYCDASTVSDEYRLNGIREGHLFRYTSEAVDIYHCPGDKRVVNNPSPYNVFRSYSISGMMYGEDAQPGHNLWKAYSRITSVKEPDGKFVFVEEGVNNQWQNAGSWVLALRYPLNQSQWWDAFAGWHNDRSTLSFADGHAEVKQWVDERTIAMAKHPSAGTPEDRSTFPENPDLIWAARAYGGLR